MVATLLTLPVQAVTTTFTNPLHTGADPDMYFKDGFYYFVKTEGDGITVWKTESPVDIRNAIKVRVWNAPSGTAYCCNVYAPDITFLNNKWYIYFTADNGDDHYHRLYVLEGKSSNAQGSYTLKGKLAPPDAPNAWAIDPAVFKNSDGKLYVLWSGRPGTNLIDWQRIYIAPMSNPYTISGNRVSISYPTYSWEKKGGDGGTFGTNEAPEVIQKNGKTFVTYSASYYSTPYYALGMVTNTNGKLLNASSWSKRTSPVFKQTSGVYGPGSNTFTKSPDGKEDWIVYHARNTTSPSEKRTIRAQKFTWGSTGAPIFGKPIAKGVQQALPSGDSIGDLIVERFVLTDSSGVEQTSFLPGRQIYPRIQVRNTGYRPVRVLEGTMTSPFLSNAQDSIPKNSSSDVNTYLKFVEIPGKSVKLFDASPVSSDRTVFPNAKSWDMSLEGAYTARVYLNNTQDGDEATYGNNQATVKYTISSTLATPTPTPTQTNTPTPTPTKTITPTPTPNPTGTPAPQGGTYVQASYPSTSGLSYFSTYDSKRTVFKVKNSMTLKKVECYRCGSTTLFVLYESDASYTIGKELANLKAQGASSGWYYANVNVPLVANKYYILRFDNASRPSYYGTTAKFYTDIDFLSYSTYSAPTWKAGSHYTRLTYSK